MNKWEQVKSSAINAISYDKEKRVLYVEFKQKKIYQYFDISQQEYFDLLSADSIGKHFNKEIQGVKQWEQL